MTQYHVTIFFQVVVVIGEINQCQYWFTYYDI